MKYLFIFFYLLLALINIEYNKNDLNNLKDSKVIRFLYQHSYHGLIIPIKKLGYSYTGLKYVCQSVVFAGLVGLLFYATCNDVKFTIIITLLVVAIIPYIYYLNLKLRYLNLIETEVFNYATNIIIYLKEKQTVTDVLINTANNVEEPLSSDLHQLLKYINDTNNFNKGLDLIETKYNYSFLKNVHILLKNAFNRGYNNFELYNYTFNSIEAYQLTLNKYRLKKAANRKLFYFMIILDLIGVNGLIHIFARELLTNTYIADIIFIYYCLNLITVIYYEFFCFKINTIEKGIKL